MRQLLHRLQRKYASSKDLKMIIFPLKFSIALQEKTSLYQIVTYKVYFTEMLGSYGIYSKQAYQLSFTLIGKTQTKHFPGQPDLVICSLFSNFLKHKISNIINLLTSINSV